MVRRVTILTVGLFFALMISAKEEMDSAFLNLFHRYYQLYDTDSVEAFKEVTGQIKRIFLEKEDMASYYSVCQNEILYEAERGQAYQAIKRANDILEEMQEDGVNLHNLVYSVLGEIFESRGDYRAAVHYYMEALNYVEPTDTMGVAQIYAQLISANLCNDIESAEEWNERLENIVTPQMLYYKVYLVYKGYILFFKGEKEQFLKVKKELDNFSTRASSVYHFGEYVMKIMESAFMGNYKEALQMLDQKSQDYYDIRRCDIRIRIFEMMGDKERALQETIIRRELRDSINNDLIFGNINDVNAAMGIAKLNEKAAREYEWWLMIIIVLIFVALGLMISRYLTHKRFQKKTEEQNKQLEIALEEAKESDRMKGLFIQHISHEIRTPLNIITGYAQVIANPDIEVDKEERDALVQTIEENTIAITDIFDDLLEISHDTNEERYGKNDQIVINKVCRRLIEKAENINKGRLKLCFTTNLPDDFTIQSNKRGIERILRQLLNNALKFTEQGQIELSAAQDADGNIRFTVTDTGVGIPEEQQEQVFENFYKVDSFKQGLGIGLSMSRKIAVLLGGSLTIDKDYHHGTRFIFTIPVK